MIPYDSGREYPWSCGHVSVAMWQYGEKQGGQVVKQFDRFACPRHPQSEVGLVNPITF